MTNAEDKEWRDLCEQVAKETDHERLMNLVEKINRVLEAREKTMPSPDGVENSDSEKSKPK